MGKHWKPGDDGRFEFIVVERWFENQSDKILPSARFVRNYISLDDNPRFTSMSEPARQQLQVLWRLGVRNMYVNDETGERVILIIHDRIFLRSRLRSRRLRLEELQRCSWIRIEVFQLNGLGVPYGYTKISNNADLKRDKAQRKKAPLARALARELEGEREREREGEDLRTNVYPSTAAHEPGKTHRPSVPDSPVGKPAPLSDRDEFEPGIPDGDHPNAPRNPEPEPELDEFEIARREVEADAKARQEKLAFESTEKKPRRKSAKKAKREYRRSAPEVLPESNADRDSPTDDSLATPKKPPLDGASEPGQEKAAHTANGGVSEGGAKRDDSGAEPYSMGENADEPVQRGVPDHVRDAFLKNNVDKVADPKMRKSRQKKAQQNNYTSQKTRERQQFIDYFHERFLKRHGTAPTWEGKQLKAVTTILERGGLTEAIKRCERMFERGETEDWLSDADITTLRAKWDVFASAKTTKSNWNNGRSGSNNGLGVGFASSSPDDYDEDPRIVELGGKSGFDNYEEMKEIWRKNGQWPKGR